MRNTTSWESSFKEAAVDRKVLAIATGMLVWLLGLCLAVVGQGGWIVWSSDRAGDGNVNLWAIVHGVRSLLLMSYLLPHLWGPRGRRNVKT